MSRNVTVPVEQLVADIGEGLIDTVLAVFADHQGRMTGKRTDGEFFVDTVLDFGTENCDYLLACDLDDTPLAGFRWASYDQGYGDMRGVVDPTTVRYLPWLERTALVIVDLVDTTSGEPVAVSPRAILQRQVAAAAEAGFVAKLGSEIEFFVFREGYDEANAADYRSLTPNSPYLEDYNILQTTKEEGLLGAIRRGLKGAGLPVEFSKGEAGRGQHEVNLTYQDAVAMADINLVFKTAVKELAHAAGRSATFMAKPHFEDAGSSFHIHSSLWTGGQDADGGRSVMAGDGDYGMSDVFAWYLGGLVATAADFTLLYAPTVNSYRRFVPGSWAPTGIAWGLDNRTLGFRVVGHGPGMRVENRIPGADANTYHAFAATLAGGLYGVVNQVEPSSPCPGNGYAAADLTRIPATFPEAIERWRNSTIAKECFGDDVHHHVLHFAELEWLAFNQTVTDWERRRYFERI
jgi:glutamine synthetase